MHTVHPCNVPVTHLANAGNWTAFCPNPVEARCYKCDKFFCDEHIRKHDCDGVDEHPASD
jgi:hypothetical protein